MTGDQLELTGRDALAVVEDLDVVQGVIASDAPAATPRTAGGELGSRNLFGEADRIAARASSPATRGQYATIYRALRTGCASSSTVRPSLRISTPM